LSWQKGKGEAGGHTTRSAVKKAPSADRRLAVFCNSSSSP
jgi:hypothetical protein